mmetsp:Transcript_39146/g.61005  ORF Transcript_39146/g.61005 Transcript_39146/m.61005 type:complete len:644 (-) Transcript_39146:297-2228(-)
MMSRAQALLGALVGLAAAVGVSSEYPDGAAAGSVGARPAAGSGSFQTAGAPSRKTDQSLRDVISTQQKYIKALEKALEIKGQKLGVESKGTEEGAVELLIQKPEEQKSRRTLVEIRAEKAARLRNTKTNEERIADLEALVGGVDVKNLQKDLNDVVSSNHALTETLNGIDSGRSAWVLTSTVLVLCMTIPGLALFYGGLVRVQNVLSTVMQSFSIACLITVLWIAFGYSLSFSKGGPVLGDASHFWLQDINIHKAHALQPHIPEPLFLTYQLMFAIITPALISGAFADRMRFASMLVFMGLWHILVYCPITHANWMVDGFLYKAGILDFAGGNVVHIGAGCAGLVSSLVVGKRTGYGTESFHPHNILVSVLGASLLWVGWLGFNGGSASSDLDLASITVLNTQVAASAASLTWMLTEWFVRKRPSVLGIISGAIAGLVTITPGAGYVNITGAFVFGLLAGPVCYGSAQMKHWLGYDDALDAFGIHAPGGALGGILTGLFATEEITGDGSGIKGAFYGNWEQLGLQLYGIVCTVAWSMFMTFALLKGIDKTIGLRVALEEEMAGLDMVMHGESILPFHLNEDGKMERMSFEFGGRSTSPDPFGRRRGSNSTEVRAGKAASLDCSRDGDIAEKDNGGSSRSLHMV